MTTFEINLESMKTVLTEEEILQIIDSFKKIIAIEDSKEAIRLTDKYLRDIFVEFADRYIVNEDDEFDDDEEDDDDEFDDEYYEINKNNINDKIYDLESAIMVSNRKIELKIATITDSENLEYAIRYIHDDINPCLIETHGTRINELIASAKELIPKLRIEGNRNRINSILNENIQSISMSRRMFRELNEAKNFLLKNDLLTEEFQNKIVEGKKRAALARMKKKLQEAEIARIKGSVAKFEKLIQEAQLFLQQDWIEAFPEDEIPNIKEFIEDK